MAGRYVPPALRKRVGESIAPSEPSRADHTPAPAPARRDRSPLLTDIELQLYFWPEWDSRQVDGLPFTPLKQRATLNDSAATPDKLAWILLFHNANPRWASDRTIFVKSNLNLLPQEPTSEVILEAGSAQSSSLQPQSPQDHREAQTSQQQSEVTTPRHLDSVSTQEITTSEPVAVFEQVRRASRGFRFAGWYRISRLQYLEPGSPDLIRMLAQKWEIKDRYGRPVQQQRDEKAWQDSLKQRWAVIQMVRDEAAEKERGEPAIERRADEVPDNQRAGKQKETRSVNELLREMRLGGSEKADTETQDLVETAATECRDSTAEKA